VAKDLKRSFHKKASLPYAALFLADLRGGDFPLDTLSKGEQTLSRSKWLGGLGSPSLTLRSSQDGEDETPAMNHLGSEASQESTARKQGTDDASSRRKNRLRLSISHKGRTGAWGMNSATIGSTPTASAASSWIRTQAIQEPLGPPLEQPHGELLASISEAEGRYMGKSSTDMDLPRMKVFFNRFALDGEVGKDSLLMIFLYLGFLTVDESKVREAADDVSGYPSLDFHDFCSVVDHVVTVEREALQRKIEVWLIRSTALRTDDVAEKMRLFLKSLGVICTKELVVEMMSLGGLANRRCDTQEELWRLLAAYRACEGFTQEEVEKANEEFDRLALVGGASTPTARMREGRFLPGQHLSEALLALETVYCADHLGTIIGEITEFALDQKGPLHFFEFLVIARRLRRIVMRLLADSFDKVDANQDSEITVVEAMEVLRHVGFTLLKSEQNELLELIGAENEERLHFDLVHSLVMEARAQHGFTKEEYDELAAHFDAYCDADGEMPNLQMYELLRYIGHENSLDEVKDLLDQVDYNHNGTMDRREYFRLMRLQKEQNLAGYRNAWCSSKMRCGRKAFQVVEKALHSRLNKHPEILGRLLAEAQAEEINAAAGDFDAFATLAENLRKQIPLESRKYASFKEVEYLMLKKIFERQSDLQDGSIILREFLYMMEDVQDVHTKGGRMWLLESLNNARQAAREAGVSEAEAGHDNSPRVRFMPVLHFTRQLVARHLREVTVKENTVLNQLKFNKGEVAQFRGLFKRLCGEYAGGMRPDGQTPVAEAPRPSMKSGRRRSMDDGGGAPTVEEDAEEEETGRQEMQTFGEWLSSFTTVPQIPASAVGRLLQPLGLRLDIGSNKAMLNRKLAELAVDGGLDFPGFLQVMEWMLEKDFCDINRLAAKHLETAAKVEEDESDFGDEEIVTITATAGRWRSQRHMSL